MVVGALQIISVDGQLLFAFPSSRTPYIFRREEVGNEFPAYLEGSRVHADDHRGGGLGGGPGSRLSAGSQLASGYVVYEFPGYLAFGGGFNYDFLDVVSLKGGISGEVDIQKPAFNLHGSIRACVVDIVCGGAIGTISGGPKSAGGVGGCVEALGINIGGGVKWNELDDPYLWPFDGCKWSRFGSTCARSAPRRAPTPSTSSAGSPARR